MIEVTFVLEQIKNKHMQWVEILPIVPPIGSTVEDTYGRFYKVIDVTYLLNGPCDMLEGIMYCTDYETENNEEPFPEKGNMAVLVELELLDTD